MTTYFSIFLPRSVRRFGFTGCPSALDGIPTHLKYQIKINLRQHGLFFPPFLEDLLNWKEAKANEQHGRSLFQNALLNTSLKNLDDSPAVPLNLFRHLLGFQRGITGLFKKQELIRVLPHIAK